MAAPQQRSSLYDSCEQQLSEHLQVRLLVLVDEQSVDGPTSATSYSMAKRTKRGAKLGPKR